MTAGTLFVALLVGHLVGDWLVQTDQQAADKTSADRRVAWPAMGRHVVGYHAAMAAVLLPVFWHPTAAAILVVSAATHALIDRRWPTRALMRATRSPQFAEQTWGVVVVDQALHLSVLALLALWAAS